MKLIAALPRLPERSRFVVLTALYGVSASLVSVAFQLAINWIFWAGFIHPSQASPKWFPWISLALISTVSIIAGWLLTKFSPEAAGSGIPQLKLAFWKDFGNTPAKLGWVKFVASGLSIGGGQSLGREGPSVQLGGNVATNLAGLMGVAKQNRRPAAAAGAAAGLAAAFNAPLAAVAFVLEEILEDLNSRLLGPVLLASVVGALVVHALLGPQPAFDLPRIDEPTWHAYVLMPLVACVAALVGVVFQRASLSLRRWGRTRCKLPLMWQPLLGGLLTWALGIAVFYQTRHLGVFGLGYDDLSVALVKGIAWKLALILLVAKLAATILCYGFGGSGGIFSPNLFFGGMVGAVIAGLGSHIGDLSESDRILLTVGGMSACLGGVVQAPVTAVLIIFEMTHQFSLVPGLMIAGLVSQFVARRFSHENFYEALLTQDGHQMSHVIPPRDLRTWQKLSVSAIAKFEPVMITDLDEAAMAQACDSKPYERFPVVRNGVIAGILTRAEFRRARLENRAPNLMPAVSARPNQTIRECQALLIESGCGMIVISDRPDGTPLGVLTLHDLLRAQAAVSEREG
jgi:CIC family chloride channel protein